VAPLVTTLKKKVEQPFSTDTDRQTDRQTYRQTERGEKIAGKRGEEGRKENQLTLGHEGLWYRWEIK
jgi:hypothetical protein